MRKQTLLVVGVVLLVLGLVGVAATSVITRQYGSRRWSGRSGIDAMFIEQMIPHHEDAIDMAELALDRAERPEIRRLAQDVIETQSAEITEMRRMYREWFGTDVPEGDGSFGMMPGMMGTPDMDDLRAADDFDKAFIEAMVPHHRMGIRMSQMAGGATRRQRMRDLTDGIIEGQSAEIDEMRGWYRDWYGD